MMAISAPHYKLLKRLAGEFQHRGRILEIGEANLYGDISPQMLAEDIQAIEDGAWRNKAADRLLSILDLGLHGQTLFDLAKLVYDILFEHGGVWSIDLNGTPAAMKINLNTLKFIWPPTVPERFELVINHGTAEHVFNIANVFRVMHERCAVGGLMIHDSPFTGWVDHGFYCLQPTVYYDVAAANGYDLRLLAVTQIEPPVIRLIERRENIHALATAGDLPKNGMLFVAMRKVNCDSFKIPMQGVYDERLSPEARQAWHALR